jgi:hypothetical protein
MSNNEALTVIFTVVGLGHLAMAYITWSRRAEWKADAERWKGFMRWITGQRKLNAELALGVLFLGPAVFV